MKNSKDLINVLLKLLPSIWEAKRITNRSALALIKSLEIYVMATRAYLRNVFFVPQSLDKVWKNLLLDMCYGSDIIFCEYTDDEGKNRDIKNKTFRFDAWVNQQARVLLRGFLNYLNESPSISREQFKDLDSILKYIVIWESERLCTSYDIKKRIVFNDSHLSKLIKLIQELPQNQCSTIIEVYGLPVTNPTSGTKNIRQHKHNALTTLRMKFFDRKKEFTSIQESLEAEKNSKTLAQSIEETKNDFSALEYDIPILFKEIRGIDDLPTHAKSVLASVFIKHVVELVEKTEEELLQIRTCGVTVIKNLKDYLAQYKLSLGMKLDPTLKVRIQTILKK